jgi:putative membrane protein
MSSLRRTSILGAAIAFAAFPAVAHGATPGAYSRLDETLLRSSIQGDRFEIIGGKQAQSQAVAPRTRALGARLVKDHSKSLKEAVKLAKALGISVPSTPTPSQEWELQMVAAQPGTAFDAAYSRLEIQDHKQDIEETHEEIDHGLNPSVRALARSDLPILRTHLRLSKQAWWSRPGK